MNKYLTKINFFELEANRHYLIIRNDPNPTYTFNRQIFIVKTDIIFSSTHLIVEIIKADSNSYLRENESCILSSKDNIDYYTSPILSLLY